MYLWSSVFAQGADYLTFSGLQETEWNWRCDWWLGKEGEN